MKLKKYSLTISALFFIVSIKAIAGDGTPNAFAKNGIHSYEMSLVTITPSGSDGWGQIAERAEFDHNGQMVSKLTTDVDYTTSYIYKDLLLTESVLKDGDKNIIHTVKFQYEDNRVTERNFDADNTPGRTRLFYKDKEGRDTLIVYTTANNLQLYKAINKYDNIGLKEATVYTATDTIYSKRVNGNKLKQVFEYTKSDGSLINRETKVFDEKGNESEFLYEEMTADGFKIITHRQTIHQDNGLIDNVFYFDSAGNKIRKEVYQYKKFDN